MEHMLMRWPFYGYRRRHAPLRRTGWTVGERVVRRLRQFLGGSRHIGCVRIQTTDSTHTHRRYPHRLQHQTITGPDDAWVADLTSIRWGTRFI